MASREGQACGLAESGQGQGTDPAHRQIAELAYSYWEARGRQGGSAAEDWLRAERELKARKEPGTTL